jgi:hypothetical protein
MCVLNFVLALSSRMFKHIIKIHSILECLLFKQQGEVYCDIHIKFLIRGIGATIQPTVINLPSLKPQRLK